MEPTDQRRQDLAFEEWLASDPRFLHLDPVETVARLGTSRRDLLDRRGERRERLLTHLVLRDVDRLLAQARARAETAATDRRAEARALCGVWTVHLEFLVRSRRWTGTAEEAGELAAALTVPPRTGLLAVDLAPVELRALQRTPIVRAAEDVLRGRSVGEVGLRARLVDLGYRTALGRPGPCWSAWDAVREEEAAAARCRLVVAETVRVLRPDPAAALVLARAVSGRPTEVARGAPQLEELVGTGRLRDLVAAGIVPSRAPWRLGRGLRPAVHVALTRLADDGLLEAASWPAELAEVG